MADYPHEQYSVSHSANALANINVFAGSMQVSSDAHAQSHGNQEDGAAWVNLPYIQNFDWQGNGPPTGTIYCNGNYEADASATPTPARPNENTASSQSAGGSTVHTQDGNNYRQTGTYYFLVDTQYAFHPSRSFTLAASSHATNDYYDYEMGITGNASSGATFTVQSAN